jgi:hypothetical protein
METGKAKRATKVTKAAPKENGELTKRVIVASLLLDAEEKHGKHVSSTSTMMSNGPKRVMNLEACRSIALPSKWTLFVVMDIRDGTSDPKSTIKRELIQRYRSP